MDQDELAAGTYGSPKPSSKPPTPKKRRVESSSESDSESERSSTDFESTEEEPEPESKSDSDDESSTSDFIRTRNEPVSDSDSDFDKRFQLELDQSTSDDDSEPEFKFVPEFASVPISDDNEQPSISGSIPTGNEPGNQERETVQQAVERLTKMAEDISRRVEERASQYERMYTPLHAEIEAARQRSLQSEARLRANLRPLAPPNSHILVMDPNNMMAKLNRDVKDMVRRAHGLRKQLRGPVHGLLEQMPQQVEYLAPRHPLSVPFRPLLLTHPVGLPWRFPRPPRPSPVRDPQPETPPHTPPAPGSPPDLVRNPLHIPLAPSPVRDLVLNHPRMPIQPSLPQTPPQPVRNRVRNSSGNPMRWSINRISPRMPFSRDPFQLPLARPRYPLRNPLRRSLQPSGSSRLTEELRQRGEEIINGPPEEIIANKFKITIRRCDVMLHLAGNGWVNDPIIDFYFNLIAERSVQRAEDLPSVYAFSFFFMQRLLEGGYQAVRRWTRKVNVFSKDLLLFPLIYKKQLWCLATIDFRNKAIRYYDSLKKSNPSPVLAALKSYLKEESMDKRKQEFDMYGYYIGAVRSLPQQTNQNDAGVFCAMYAEYLSRNAEITFTQQDMEYFRMKMIVEIATGKLQEGEPRG